MNKHNLKLVKSGPKTERRQTSTKLTPAEKAEAERFRQLTAARAARRAMISRIMADLHEFDQSAA